MRSCFNAKGCDRDPATVGTMRSSMVSVAFLLLLLLLQMTVEAARHTGCPADCSCLGNMVDCSKKRLKRMPDDLPTWVQVL